MKKTRNEIIDIVRGIGIFLVVLGHTVFPYSKFLYLFHVAIFIIASGYFFKSSKVDSFSSLKKTIIGKIKTLYMPYIIINITFVLLNNILLDFNIYNLSNHYYFSLSDYIINIIKVLLFRGVTELAGATWFLNLLFFIICMYSVISHVILKKVGNNKLLFWQLIVSILFLIVGLIINDLFDSSLLHNVIQYFCCYWLYYFGHWLSTVKLKINYTKSLLFFILNFIILLFLSNVGEIEISKNQYSNIIFYVIVSVIGWFFVNNIAVLIEKFKIKNFFTYIGENSLSILCFHFVGFKIINVLLTFINNDKSEMFSGFPTSYNSGYYWLLYTFFGILFSLLINYIYKCIKNNKK